MEEYTVAELIGMVRNFCEERDWNQSHNPKDLAIGISTEANELLDIFRFKDQKDMELIMQEGPQRVHVGEELADVLFFTLRFAQMYHLDLKEILEDKIEKNARKYPMEKAK